MMKQLLLCLIFFFCGVGHALEVPRMSLSDAVTFERLGTAPGEKVQGIFWDYSRQQTGEADFYTVTVNFSVSKDRGLVFTAGIPFSRKGADFLRTPYVTEKVNVPRIYAEYFPDNITGGPDGRFSRYPVGAVARGKEAAAFAIDWKLPVKYRIEYDAEKEMFNIHFDFAAVPEHKQVKFRFAFFKFVNTWGFRSALAKYYRIFPDFSVNRIKEHGMFVAFAATSGIKDAEDFHIRLRDTYYEPTWDEKNKRMHWPHQKRIAQELAYGRKHNVQAFRYHEPGNWWMPIKKGSPRTRENAEKQLRELAALGHPRAQAVLQAPLMTADGKMMLTFSRQTWNDGCVWSISTVPGMDAPARFRCHYLIGKEKINSYDNDIGRDLAGEMYDSMGGYMRDPLDFNRKSLAASKVPAVFDTVTGRAAVSLLLMQAEYSAWSSAQVRAKGRLTGANNVRSPLLAPYFDTISSEANWKRGGKWIVQDKEELLFYRALCKNKIHSPHLNTDMKKLSVKELEIFLKRNIAFGHIPNVFNDLGTNYFRQPKYYNRDRALFKRYVPLAARLSMAGWEPETLARSNSKDILVERFGKYLTVYNDCREKRYAVLTIDGLKNPLKFPLAPAELKVFDLKGNEIRY
ncbi:MAG: hypothetical protein IKC65_05905 [Lentisphaeria bacterium]|nr:hypothetical protein [Lentisphaeria bacterium]